MLVGRASERQALGTALAAARVADSRALVVCGEAGIGKTALLREARGMAEEMLVLSAQGVASERYLPFAGLSQLLRPVLPLLDQIPPPQASALAGALALETPGAPASSGGAEGAAEGAAESATEAPAEPSRFAVGAATLSLLARAAEDRPVLALVDDGHLLDRPSAEAIVFAARRMLSDAVAVLVAVRPEEPGARAFDVLPTLPLAGLEVDDAAELLAGLGGPVSRADVARLHAATAGNPLALLELRDDADRMAAMPASAPSPVPERVAESFARRLEGLAQPVRTTLTVAAADATSLRTVLQAARVLGVEAPTLLPAEDAGLLTLTGDAVEFRHPLAQAAVYAAAEPALRRAVHRALAQVVPAADEHRLAWHLAEGAEGPDEETAVLLGTVAAGAAARGAHAIAARAHERAAVLSADPSLVAERLAAAGEAAWLAGRTERAAPLLEQALAAGPSVRLRAHVQEVRGAVELRSGSLDVALRTLRDAAADVASADTDLAVRLYADTVHVAFYLLDPGAAMAACREIEHLLSARVTEGTRRLGMLASGMALVLSGAGVEGVRRLEQTAYRLVVPQPPVTDRFRLPLRVQGALWLRDAGPDREVVADALNRMREDAALGSLPYLLMHVGRDAATSDRWDEAEASYQEAARLAAEIGQTTDHAMATSGLAMLHARRGRSDDVAAHVAASEASAVRNGVRLATLWLGFARGDLAAGAGDLEQAATWYEATEDLLASRGLADPDQSCAAEYVECLVQLGREAEAGRVATAFADRAAAKGQAWSLARAARAEALVSRDPEPAYLSALELHAQTPDGYEAARTRLAYGAWLRRARRRVDARPVLRSALATFEALGARPWADRAAQELDATGERAQRRSVDSRGELTPQERQVAQLLAEGRTTRQAAAALFLSPKTVEYHLRHVYLKLGIGSRAELADRLG